ncbi:MAG: RNA polymerase sigma factor [Nannocystaceae bacterium]|nr:sigma-70 family RNA polymerase sigma factor [bacterium]
MTLDPNAELVAAWMRGAPGADHALVRHYYGGVRRFFDLRCTHAADDLTQQTFLALFEAKHRYEGRSQFKTFLFGIAHKQLLRYLQSQEKGPRARRYGTESGEATSLSMVAVRKQEHQLVLMALTQLPVPLQVLVELYYWEDMSLAEIAEVVDANQSTLGSRLARARELLRENIAAMTRPGPLRESLLADLEGWSRALGPVTAAANRSNS